MTRNKRQSRRRLHIAVLLIAVYCCGSADVSSDQLDIELIAQPTVQLDQSNMPEWTGGWTHVNPNGQGEASMWQTFSPNLPYLAAVEIEIMTVNPGRGDDVLTVEIARAGEVMASETSAVQDGFEGIVRFEFPSSIAVSPGIVYELKVRDTGKTTFGWKYGGNTYDAGSRYVFSEERPGTDWFFQTFGKQGAGLIYTDDIGQFGINWNRPELAYVTEIAPDGVVPPVFSGDGQLYGTILVGDAAEAVFHYAVDLFGLEENLDSVDFYFDRNRNGDLTDDGLPLSMRAGRSDKIASFDVPYQHGATRPYSIRTYVYYRSGSEEYHVAYYRDCGWMGDVTFGSETAFALLLDDNNDGLYYDEKGSDYLCIDWDDDGSIEWQDGNEERIRYKNPFMVNDIAYAVDAVHSDGTSVLFREVPMGTVTGTVRSAIDGEVIADAKVEVWSSIRVDTLTDGAGSYSLNVPEGKWTFRASKLGYVPTLVYGVRVSTDQPSIVDAELSLIPYPNSGTITLTIGESYDFATGQRGQHSGGDFYVSTGPGFWANNQYQRGLVDLGDIGNTPLEQVVLPESGYTRFGVDAVLAHTYVSLAREGEEGCFIVFRIISLSPDSVTIDYALVIGP